MCKKGMIAGCIVLILLVAAAGIWMLRYHSVKREATRAEIRDHAVYFVDWTHADGWQVGMTAREYILSQCSVAWEETGCVFYTSDTLGQYLYGCEKIDEIYMLEDVLHVYYIMADGSRVTLQYTDEPTIRLWVYDIARDILYAETEDGATVTTNYYRSLRRRVEYD